MEGRLTEERVTKWILKWLIRNGWDIVCFDFPQSWTGVMLHSKESLNWSKNKDSIIPDIVTIKDTTVLFLENKDRFVLSDFEKINILRTSNKYEWAITDLLKKYSYKKIYYWIWLPTNKINQNKINQNKDKVDFIVWTDWIECDFIYKDDELFRN